MASLHFASAAAAIAFTLLAAACSSSEQARGPVNIAAVEREPATPEFHGAAIGDDSLRGQLDGE
jgi:hypothetical protein